MVLEAAARLSAGSSLADSVAAVDEIVRAEAERPGRRCAVDLEPRDGVPGLLPAFVRMAGIHPRPRRFRRALGSAALAIAETALDGDRFLLFFLAWVRGKPLDAILETLEKRGRLDGRRTLQRRLRRISDTIEGALVKAVVQALPYAERTWLRAAAGAPRGSRDHAPRPPGEASWTILAGAIDVLTCGRPPRGGAADTDFEGVLTPRM